VDRCITYTTHSCPLVTVACLARTWQRRQRRHQRSEPWWPTGKGQPGPIGVRGH